MAVVDDDDDDDNTACVACNPKSFIFQTFISLLGSLVTTRSISVRSISKSASENIIINNNNNKNGNNYKK